MGQKIVGIVPGSIAEELGCEVGDELLSINGEKIRDVVDYQYFVDMPEVLLEIRNVQDGEIVEAEVEKEEGEPLGFIFASPLMSMQRSCANKCLFCFVDQMPEGLRPSLYVKDDDWRMSFMMGSFITLTNISDMELSRIIERGVSPLYISVQATAPALRAKLLGNSGAGKLMEQLWRLKEGGIHFHAQLVLCHGYNDGDMLERSLRDLWSLYPATLSVACVPVGLTNFRDLLPDMRPYTKEQAEEVLDIIEAWQQKCLKEQGTHFVYASDEFYILAEKELPDAEDYEGFPQIENGVGMIAKFEMEFEEAKKQIPRNTAEGKHYTIATGVSAYPWICKMVEKAEKHTGAKVEVLKVENDFFGHTVTVAGLLVGRDLIAQLSQNIHGECLMIPANMLRSGEDVFLDHMQLEELKAAMPVPVRVIEADGESFLKAISGWEEK